MRALNRYANSTTITVAVMVVVIVIALLYIIRLQQQSATVALESSQAGQAFSYTAENYTDVKGHAISLEALVGEPFVVTSWASWCPHCFAELQTVDTIMADFPTVPTLGINRSESQAQVNRYLASKPALIHTELIRDTTDQFFAAVEGYTMPETILFDKTGVVIYHDRGQVDATALRAALTAQINESR